MLNKNETSNTLTLLVNVYLNIITFIQRVRSKQQKRNFWMELSEVSKSRDSSNRYFTEASTHSTFVIVFYISTFPKKNRQRNKQISRFVFIPEVNNKLRTAG